MMPYPSITNYLDNIMNATKFVIYSDTSRNGTAGLRPQVLWNSEQNIIAWASRELEKSGTTLEDLAGVAWIEDADGCLHAARELTDAEILSLSIEKLNDDGRLCRVFDTDEVGAAEFVEAAKQYWIDDKARAVVDQFFD